MVGRLANKVAVVTGASKEIGAAIARHLAGEGAAVVVNYSTSQEGADRVVRDIVSAGGKAIAVGADLTMESEIAKLFEATKKHFGRVDVLVNNAGVYTVAPIEAVTPELWCSRRSSGLERSASTASVPGSSPPKVTTLLGSRARTSRSKGSR